MNTTLVKSAAITLAVVTLALYVAAAAMSGDHARDLYCLGILTATAACTGLVILVLEATVQNTIRRQFKINRACLAESIAQALADELDRREVPDNVSTLL